MPSNKRHHFVPKLYLRRFSQDGASIRTYNIAQDRVIERASIKGQCYRDYMYGKDPQAEKHLSQIEGLANVELKRIVQLESLPEPYTSGWQTMLAFILLQHTRTAYEVDAQNEMMNDVFRQLAKQDTKVSEILTKYRVTFNDLATIGIQAGLESYLLIGDLRWMLVTAPKGSEFVTSDAPVVFYNQLFEHAPDEPAAGTSSRGLEILFPLGPAHLLLLYDETSYRAHPKTARVVTATADDVTQLNLVQYVAAYENLYFHRRFDVSGAVRRLGSRLRRQRKTRLSVHPQEDAPEGHTRELLMMGHVRVRTGLTLSFLSPSPPARKWLAHFLAQPNRPAVAIRNESLHAAYRRFQGAVDQRTDRRVDFARFMLQEAEQQAARRLLAPRRQR